MIQYMKENNIEKCIETVREYIKAYLPDGLKYLEQNGIEARELRSSSPIRLLIADE